MSQIWPVMDGFLANFALMMGVLFEILHRWLSFYRLHICNNLLTEKLRYLGSWKHFKVIGSQSVIMMYLNGREEASERMSYLE